MSTKLSTAVSDFVRSIFGREQKMIQDLSIANSNLVAGQKLGGASLPGIDVDTLGRIEDSVGLDRRRLYRYVDYEEMDDYGAIAAILDIYSDDASQLDASTQKTVWTECQDEPIKKDLDNLFTKRLRMEENAWEIIRSLCKYGDDLEEIVVGDTGVVGLNYLPASTMHRIEGRQGGLKGFVQSYDPSININPAMFDKMKFDQGEAASPQGHELLYEDWRVAHMRLRSQSRGSLYGRSISDAARWTWKRLLLLEDAVLVFKLTRSPSRYIFYIDVADMPTKQAEAKIQEVKRRIKKRKFINPKTGKPDFRFSPLPVAYDSPIPLLDGRTISIKKMAEEFDEEKKHWVYSIDRQTGNLVPGEVEWVGKTRENAPAVKVTLKDGSYIKVAPDHPVMRRDRSYVLASTLNPNDRVMPFCRTIKDKLPNEKGTAYKPKETEGIVSFVEFIEPCDHYCMTVKKWHNFALTAWKSEGEAIWSSGVFVKNSMDEDFFLGVRDGKESTRIDTLNGPSYQQVEDVQYFLHKLYSDYKVPRAYMGDDSNMPSRATLCISGDTKIPLLDGTCPTIKELSKRKEPFWVYSMDKNNNVVPGLAKDARVTRKRAKTIDVELDNKEVFRCTPDHPVMMRGGEYKEAGELKEGDSVMPFYRRRSAGKGKGQTLVDYEQIYSPGDDKWKYTHRMVTDCLFEKVDTDQVRHHVNFKRHDNRPENIEIMNKDEHFLYHSKQAEKVLLSPAVQEKRKKAHAKWLKTDRGKGAIKKAAIASKRPDSKFWDWVHSDRHKEMKSEQMKKQWEDPSGKMRKSRESESYRKKLSAITKRRIADGKFGGGKGPENNKWRHDADFGTLVRVAEEYRCKSKKELIKWSGYSECLINRLLSEHGITYHDFSELFMVPSKMRDVAYTKMREPGYLEARSKNHKVKTIRPGPVINTYDLTVDGYHNFAVQAGMFIHNSSEDVQFCRIVLRIQREFRNGMHKVGRVHLAARRIDPMAVDFNIAMTVPSSIFELGQLEVKRARADLASTMERHVSLYWLLSNIYGLPDGEIGEVMKQKEAEAKKATEMGGMESSGPGVRTLGNFPLVPLSERELLEGNRKHEKELENKLKDLMGKTESRLGAKLKETGYLIRDIAAAAKK